MTVSDDNSPSSPAAAGVVRLFPLPNLVMFPHVVQPLHIFEPRYCDLLEDALAGDKLIAMVLLQPGWESNYEGRPALAPVACLGKIMAHERLPTGRHNILLRGMRRAAIRRELPPRTSFRQAEVDVLEDFYPASNASRMAKLHREVVERARQLLPHSDELHEQLDELLGSAASLGMLTDIFGFTLGFPSSVKQRLLAEWNVERRATLLLERLAADQLEAGPTEANDFPPRFSLN